MTKHKSIRNIWLLAAILSMLLVLLGGCGKPANSTDSSATTITSEIITSVTDSSVTEENTTTSGEKTSETSISSSQSKSSNTTKSTSKKTTTKATSAATTTSATSKLNIDVYNSSNVQGKLAVWFFTMPHSTNHTGDCTLIRTPGGKTMLIDTGSADGGKMVNKYLDKLGIKKLDVLVITHMHQDHVGGAVNILRHVSVESVYGSPLKDYNTSMSRNFRNELLTQGLTYNILKTGDKINLDTNVTLETLWPGDDFTIPPGVTPESDGGFTNNSSVVLRMQYGSRSFLFTGDIEMEVEDQLVNSMPNKLKCDVLKIPHHGAATSSSSSFVRAANAKYGAIMVYAMNDINVINRYKALGTQVHLTSINGTALFITDGKTLQYASEK
jgi:competence protein ComEC